MTELLALGIRKGRHPQYLILRVRLRELFFQGQLQSIIKPMSFPNKRRLQESAMSFETSTTNDDSRDRMFKINLIAPKRQNLQPLEGLARLDSIGEGKEAVGEIKKRQEGQGSGGGRVVRGQGLSFQGFLKGQDERNSVKQQHPVKITTINTPRSNQNTSIFNKYPSINNQVSNKGFTTQPSPKLDFNKSLSVTPHSKQEKESALLENASLAKAVSSSVNATDNNLPNGLNLSRDDSEAISQVLEMIDIDCIPQHHSPHDNNTTVDLSQKESTASKATRPALIQSSVRNDSKSNSKMKLRDYLYMVQATSKHSSKKTPTTPTNPTSKGFPAPIPTPALLKDSSKLERSSISSKRESQKYHISNAMMFQILKKQIHEDIKHVMHNLKRVDEDLVSVEPRNEDPSNEDLLVLYSLRRQIKEEMNKKLENAIEAIKAHKMGHIEPKTRTMRERQGECV